MKKRNSALPVLISAFAFSLGSPKSHGAELQPKRGDPSVSGLKLKISVGSKVATAILEDNPTSRDFLSLLPLNLTLEDYNSIEKISYLSRKLTKKDDPEGADPSVGDIAYYAPWGNLVLYYKDFSYSKGLIKLGKVDSGLEVLSASGPKPVKATIELMH